MTTEQLRIPARVAQHLNDSQAAADLDAGHPSDDPITDVLRALQAANVRADRSRRVRVTAAQATVVREYAETLYVAASSDSDPATRLPDQNAARAVVKACHSIERKTRQ